MTKCSILLSIQPWDRKCQWRFILWCKHYKFLTFSCWEYQIIKLKIFQWHSRTSKPSRKTTWQESHADIKVKYIYHQTYLHLLHFPQLSRRVNSNYSYALKQASWRKLILNFQMTYHSLSVKREFLKVSLNNSLFESLAEFSQKQRTFVILVQSLLSLSHHRFLLKHQI